MKPTMGRIIEHSDLAADDGTVHYDSVPGADFVTLCGVTDWIGHPKAGTPTRKPVTCRGCRAIVAYVQGSRRERL